MNDKDVRKAIWSMADLIAITLLFTVDLYATVTILEYAQTPIVQDTLIGKTVIGYRFDLDTFRMLIGVKSILLLMIAFKTKAKIRRSGLRRVA